MSAHARRQESRDAEAAASGARPAVAAVSDAAAPSGQTPVEVIADAGTAALALEPTRLRILEALRDPDSAASVARLLGLPRQRVGYHVKELENGGLLRHVEDRRRGNCIERIVVSTARHYLVSPSALGDVGADPAAVRDRFSSSYLVALAGRTVREVASLQESARRAGKRLPTLSLDVTVRFADPASQHGFAEELSNAVAGLAAKYHDAAAPAGRAFRFTLAGYPVPAGGGAEAASKETGRHEPGEPVVPDAAVFDDADSARLDPPAEPDPPEASNPDPTEDR